MEVDKKALANVLGQAHRDWNLRGVILNACYRANQAYFIADAVKMVIVMEQRVSDLGAIAFAKVFYTHLARGNDIQKSFRWAEDSVGLQFTKKQISPELLQRD
jgi:hypothetical protein